MNAKDLISCYKQIFNTPEGKVVLEDMMIEHKVMDHHCDDMSHAELMRRLGERNVVLRIMTILDNDAEKLLDDSVEGTTNEKT